MLFCQHLLRSKIQFDDSPVIFCILQVAFIACVLNNSHFNQLVINRRKMPSLQHQYDLYLKTWIGWVQSHRGISALFDVTVRGGLCFGFRILLEDRLRDLKVGSDREIKIYSQMPRTFKRERDYFLFVYFRIREFYFLRNWPPTVCQLRRPI